MSGYRNPRAIVLTTAGIVTDTGEAKPLPPGLSVNDLPAVLSGAVHRIGAGNEGVVMLGTDVETLSDHITRKRPESWKWTELRPWTSFRHPASGTMLHVGLLADENLRTAPLFTRDNSPREIAGVLARYHELTGGPFHTMPGVAGLGALRARHSSPRAGAQPLWRHTAPSRALRGAGPLVWAGEVPTDADGHVHVFDVNAMYLAALRNALVAWGPLQHTGAEPFDPTWAGYWLIGLDHVPRELYDGRDRPPVFSAAHATDGAVWLTTPVVEYLAGLGVHPDIIDSWTHPNRGPVFRSYAERLMSARTGMLGEVPPTVRDAIKATYAQMVGLLGREGGRVHRPDWHHTVMDLARMNFLRRLDKAHAALGLWPVAVRTDAAYFLSPDDRHGTIGTALGASNAAGTFRFQETRTVESFREKVATGVNA